MPTFNNLINDIKKETMGRDPSKYPTGMKVHLRRIIVAKGVKTVYYNASVIGQTGKKYNQTVAFSTDVSDTPKRGYVKYKGVNDKKEFYYRIPSLSKDNIRITATCPDHLFRFSYALSLKKALIGKWHRYKRKTPLPPKGRPPVNPKNILGFCKHIYAFINKLKESGMVTRWVNLKNHQ